MSHGLSSSICWRLVRRARRETEGRAFGGRGYKRCGIGFRFARARRVEKQPPRKFRESCRSPRESTAPERLSRRETVRSVKRGAVDPRARHRATPWMPFRNHAFHRGGSRTGVSIRLRMPAVRGRSAIRLRERRTSRAAAWPTGVAHAHCTPESENSAAEAEQLAVLRSDHDAAL
jgi:hypothetical protein